MGLHYGGFVIALFLTVQCYGGTMRLSMCSLYNGGPYFRLPFLFMLTLTLLTCICRILFIFLLLLFLLLLFVLTQSCAVRQLHREFLRAGSDVMQALTFYASDDKLENRGNEAQEKYTVIKPI